MEVSDVSLSSISGFSFHRLPADIAAAEAARPLDAIDRGIGALLGFAHIPASRAHIKHTPAIGEDAVAVGLGAGVKNFDALDLARRVEPSDQSAALIISRIAFRRHHYGEGCVRIPAQIEILQLPVARG